MDALRNLGPGRLDTELVDRMHMCDWGTARPATLSHSREFVSGMDLLRNRLRHIIDEMRRGQPHHRAGDLQTALRMTCSAFQRLRDSSFAWQDIHAEDRELVAQAERLLDQGAIRGDRQIRTSSVE